MQAERPAWRGRTVACIASGPSLTPEDCEAVRAAGLTTVVTNSTIELCPWADVLYAHDVAWWKANNSGLADFKGRRVCASPDAWLYGAESTFGLGWCVDHFASGACAISYALGAGAAKVVLLGYDCQFGSGGRKHHHADHTGANCESIEKWPQWFERVAQEARWRSVKVLNASRETALTMFERRDIRAALA